MRTPRILAVIIALFLALPAATRAQEPADPAPAGADPAADLAEARDRLHLLLLRPDVRRVARDHGIDLGAAHDRVETLGPAALARIAPLAGDLDQVDAAADAVTISTTTIIIGLLVLILLILVL